MNALGYILMTYTCINPKIDHSTPKEYAKPKKGVTGFDHLHPEQIQIIEIFYDVFVCFYSEFGIKSRLVYYIKYKQLYERGDSIHVLIDLITQPSGDDLFIAFEHIIEEAEERRKLRLSNLRITKLMSLLRDNMSMPSLKDMKEDLRNGKFDITEPIVKNVLKKMFPDYKNEKLKL